MPTMNDKYLNIQTKLKEELNVLIGKIREIDDNVEVDASGDDVDYGNAKSMQDLSDCIKGRDVLKLKSIQEALAKLANGEFGICEECGEPIPVRRLEINPTFRLCVVCAEQLEKAR
jgi:DnaK suppressor protein